MSATADAIRDQLDTLEARLAEYRASIETVDDVADLATVRDQLAADLAATGEQTAAYAARFEQATADTDRRTRRRIVRAIRRYQRQRLHAGTQERATLAHELLDRVEAITAVTVTSRRCTGHTTTTAARPVMADNYAAHAPPRIGEHPMTCTSPP